MRRWIGTAAAGLGTAALLLAVTVNGDLNVLGTLTASVVDFRSAASTAPAKSGTALPSSCEVGQAYFKTDAAAGQNLYLCTAANTWTPAAGGGSGGAFDWRPSSRYVVYRSDMTAYYNYGGGALGDLLFIRSTGSTNLNNPSPSIPFLHPGIASITTTSTSGNRIAWWASFGGSQSSESESYYAYTTRPWEFVVIFRFPASTDYTNSSFFIGLVTNSTENPPRGVSLRYLSGTDANLTIAYSNQNSWGDSIDTGVAPDTNWHRLKIRSDGSTANKIWISLDGGTEYSACPSGCDLDVSTYLSHQWSGMFRVDLTTNEAAVKSVWIDYIHFWLDLGAER